MAGNLKQKSKAKIKAFMNIVTPEDSSVVQNMALSGLCKPVSMIVSYIYVPIVLKYLGVEKYGVWATILTILSWIGYFDIGIGNGLRNQLTMSLSKKDGQRRKLVSSAYAFIAVIMIIAAIVFSVFASYANWNRIFGVNDIQENLAAVVIISVWFVALNFILSICKNVLYALQKAADVSVMELATQILNLIGILIAKQFVASNLFIMAFVYGTSMITVNLVASIIIYEKNREISPGFRYVDIKVGRSITSLGLQFFVIQICTLILFTTDSLIISYLYGASDVTPYNTVNKLFNVIIGIHSAILAPVWSNVTKLKAENDYDGIRKLIGKLLLLMIPIAIGTVLLMFIFRPLSRLWLGVDIAYTTPLIIFGALYCLLSIWCNTYATCLNGLQAMKPSMLIACIQAIVNIPVSLFMAQRLSLYTAGVLGGTVFSMTISAVASPIIANYEIKKLKEEKNESNL